MTINNREFIINRLKEDLIGPRFGLTEAVFERPSNIYLTGILYPKKTKVNIEDDEKSDDVNGKKNSDGEPAEANTSTYKNFKPAAAGISFVVDGNKEETPSIRLVINFGKYQRNNAYILVPELNNDNNIESSSSSLNLDFEYYWEREQINISRDIVLQKKPQKFSLSDDGFPHINVFVKSKQLEDSCIVTIQLINEFEADETTDFFQIDEMSLFQFDFELTTLNKTVFVPRKSVEPEADDDSRVSNLIYRNIVEYASGHNCSAEWDAERPPIKIKTSWMPMSEVKPVSADGDELISSKIKATSISKLSAQAIYEQDEEKMILLLNSLAEGYSDWIKKEEEKIGGIIEENNKKQARININRCKIAHDRIKAGIDYLSGDHDALKAFKIANLAMRIQRSWSEGKTDWKNPGTSDLIWRPFQLAFVLLCLPSASDRKHKEREIFDLIWFPTGGGKTEAYLLLTAYVLILRRLKNPKSHARGVSAIMRYTLRTLTVQQFQRAAAMILACEILRKDIYQDILGSEKFSIGLWVGDGTTPNSRKDAYDRLMTTGSTSTPAQLKICPRCSYSKAELDWKAERKGDPIKCFCRRDECDAEDCMNELPILTVDDDIYANPPSLLIGTVDKFAQIVRKKESGRLFGTGGLFLPPDLIIQDELHLISGPLGSLTGIYEIAIDELCSTEVGRAKIIGSTATIKRADTQIKALYDRESFQFPPAAIDESSSGFSFTDYSKDGRMYIGLTTAGRSAKFSVQAVAGSLLQSGVSPQLDSKTAEYYTTLVCYYISLKELGGALVVMQDDVPKTLRAIANQRCEKEREVSIPEELTSRKPSSEIPNILEKLSRNSDDPDFIDILLASNMLSVGVDIPRLGMMIVDGQPKSMSEYIQATSRVGRTTDGPGLVVAVYNNNKVRDKSHFENFKTWHSALYRSVEANSVTPFASRARDKALHAPLVALVRHRLRNYGAKMSNNLRSEIENKIIPTIVKRVENIDDREFESAQEELIEFLDYWEERSEITTFWNDYSPSRSLLISAEKEANRVAAGWGSYKSKPTLNSVRNVEPSVLFKVRGRIRNTKNGDIDG